jgi:hypothetical protein
MCFSLRNCVFGYFAFSIFLMIELCLWIS